MAVSGLNVNAFLQVDKKFKIFTTDRIGETAHPFVVSCLLWPPTPLCCTFVSPVPIYHCIFFFHFLSTFPSHSYKEMSRVLVWVTLWLSTTLAITAVPLSQAAAPFLLHSSCKAGVGEENIFIDPQGP